MLILVSTLITTHRPQLWMGTIYGTSLLFLLYTCHTSQPLTTRPADQLTSPPLLVAFTPFPAVTVVIPVVHPWDLLQIVLLQTGKDLDKAENIRAFFSTLEETQVLFYCQLWYTTATRTHLWTNEVTRKNIKKSAGMCCASKNLVTCINYWYGCCHRCPLFLPDSGHYT